jgi:methylglyoxal reductase
MRYKKLGNGSLSVSVVGQGTWALGNDFFGEVDVDQGIKAIQASIDAGINMVDTAPGYGQHFESEIAVGKAIKGRRDKVCLATKCGIHRIAGEYVKGLSPRLVRWEMEQSLKRLQTDYIDLYMIHWPDANNGIVGALEELAKMKKEGLCREVGVSNFTPEEMKIAVEIAGIVSCQPPLSLLDQRSLNNGVVQFCRENNIGCVTYGALGGGILSGKLSKPTAGGKEQRVGFYNCFEEPGWSKAQEMLGILKGIGDKRGAAISEVAINWVLSQPGVTCALMGATTPEMALENAKAGDWELTADEVKTIDGNYKRIFEL